MQSASLASGPASALDANPWFALDENPGVTLDANPWVALDDPAEWQGFSQPAAGRAGWWESNLSIGGMHCAGCSLAVEDLLTRLPGVASAQVNGPAALALVTWSPQQSRPSDWLAALRQSGYEGLPAADITAAGPRRQAQRLLLWRWMVAGFCMMQVMMYAYPAYIAAPGDIAPDSAALLGWASWVLTLPVMLFSCRPFFDAAWRDLRYARIGMDVPVALGIQIGPAAVCWICPADASLSG